MRRKIIFLGVLFWCLATCNMVAIAAPEQACSTANQAELNAQIKRVWAEMIRALTAKDIEKALTFIVAQSRQHYRDLFAVLYDNLPEIAREIQDIKSLYIKRNSAKFLIQKAEQYGGQAVTIDYEVYFVLDHDGLWRIDWF